MLMFFALYKPFHEFPSPSIVLIYHFFFICLFVLKVEEYLIKAREESWSWF